MKDFVALLLGCAVLLASGGCKGLQKEVRDLPPMRFEGAKTFDDATLAEVVADEVGEAAEEAWERSAIDDGAFAIERFYAEEGFAFAHVEYEVLVDEKGNQKALFRVDEGPRVALVALRFEGETTLRRETLESFFPEAPRRAVDPEEFERPVEGELGPPWWVESRLKSAARSLEDHYYKSGFLEAQVSTPFTTLDDEDRRAAVVITITEGTRSRLSHVVIEDAPEEELPALQRATRAFIDRPFSPLITGALRGRFEELLAESGYPDAVASAAPPERAEDGATTLTFSIAAGLRVTIGAIEIRGTKRTRHETIEKLLELEVGDVYSVEKERETFRALYQSGLFQTVHVGLEPGLGEERTLVIEVTESTFAEFYVEPGYGSYEQLRIGMGARFKNLFGTGRTLEIDSSLAELAQHGRISLVTPRLLDLNLRSTVSVFTNRREEPSFTSSEYGAAWILARRLGRRLSATLGYQFRSTSVSDVDVVGPQVQALIDAVEISSIALTPVWDTRDSVFVPTDGTVTKLTFEGADAAIGSELDFLRFQFGHSSYFPVWKDGVLATSWRGGLIAPMHSSTSIPLQERFFNGGENTVRSFREDELGPKDIQGNPVGGETYQVFSIELRQKLKGNLDAGVFFDTGNVELDHTDFFDYDGFRSGYGVGLRYVLPIGPIRLDYGINPDPRSGESDSVLHFTVGMAF